MYSRLMTGMIFVIGCTSNQYNYHYTQHADTSFAPKRIVPVAIDTKFSIQEQKELKLAITEWNMALNNQMRLDIYTDKFDMQDNTISYIYNAHGFMMLKVDRLGGPMFHIDENTIAITSHIGTGHEIYFLKEKANVERLHLIALHEIGHILGAHHINTGLMKWKYDDDDYACIDASTIIQVADYNELDRSKMNWCER